MTDETSDAPTPARPKPRPPVNEARLLALLGSIPPSGGGTTNPLQDERNRRLLKSPVRASIVDCLVNRRGVSLSQLCRERSLGWGTVQHHIHLLERAGLIYSVAHGRNRLFFHPSIDRNTSLMFAHLANRLSEGLARSISDSPGITQNKLCEHLHITRKAFRHRMNELVRAGLVWEERRARSRAYWPTEQLKGILARHTEAPAPPA